MALGDLRLCPNCLHYLRERDEARRKAKTLERENRTLRQELNRQHRTIHEPPFGSSTPSAKLPFKPDTTAERQARKGGAKPGHPGRGRGRQRQRPQRPPEIVRVPQLCPDCARRLEAAATRTRTLVGCDPPQTFTRTVQLEEAWCPCCRKTIRTQAPEAFPRLLLDNSALAYVAVEHFLYGVTLGRLAAITGLAKGTLTHALNWLAELLAPGLTGLEQELRLAAVIWADETVWRNDGANGYAWMFRTTDLVVYRFCGTRAGLIPLEVLGTLSLLGVLITDRYAGYNGVRMARQFCYAHLLRDLQDLQKQFPQEAEISAFVATLAPRLGAAMRLRHEVTHRPAYRRRARQLQRQILKAINRTARHPAIQSYQDIFRHHPDNLFHWVENPQVPPDNNYAERGLRPTVIARKLSFGSQSERGARTRQILMSITGTIALRTDDPWRVFRDALNRLAAAPTPGPADLTRLLFPKPQDHTTTIQTQAA